MSENEWPWASNETRPNTGIEKLPGIMKIQNGGGRKLWLEELQQRGMRWTKNESEDQR